jgi:peptidoglycan/xylan/chitin deacetylase (PgdA/CDA1 family)
MLLRRHLILAPFVRKRRIALTLDDFNPAILGSDEVAAANRQFLGHLDRAGLQAVAFVIGGVNQSAESRGHLEAWSQAGHRIANHTWSHRNYNNPAITGAEFSADTARAHAFVSTFRTFTPMLRFPMLKEGETAAKRDHMRGWMRAEGYRNGHVAIDGCDWLYSQYFLRAGRAAKFREPYLNHLERMASFSDALAGRLGIEAPLTLLLHYNAINLAFLPDVIAHFRALGWEWVDAARAFEDPLYQKEPNRLPAGESLLWALDGGKERHQGEQDKVEEEILRRLL